MKPLAKFVAILAVIIIPLLMLRANGPATTPDPGPSARTEAGQPESKRPVPKAPASDLMVRDVTIRDLDGQEVWRGDVDLEPELSRARSGERDEHRNDGGVFANREGLLPAKRRGYYREYVVRTDGMDHAGPQRLILGEGGEVFYTSDHYASFRRIQ